jgi:chromate reductase
MKKTNILAIQGSLRPQSSSHHILQAVLKAMPTEVTVVVYDNIGKLPHFDDQPEPPLSVVEFRKQIRESDGVIICTPEYAFGIPGSLKNALDWTVGSGEFVDKPVALITASSQGERGHAAMRLVLQAISARVEEQHQLLISAVRSQLHPEGTIKDENTAQQLRILARSFAERLLS